MALGQEHSSNGRPHISSDTEPLTNFAQYGALRSSGLIVPMNSQQILWKSLTAGGVFLRDSGFNDLGVYRNRNSRNQVFGSEYTIHATAEAVKVAASNPEHDKGLLFYGPTGSGKSNIVDITVKSVEATAPKIPGLLAIKDCPIKEDPDHLLNLKNVSGRVSSDVKPHGDLCPCCQIKYEGLSAEEIDAILLAPLKFRSRTGEQIVRLQPSDTQFKDSLEGLDRLVQLIQAANRGLLVVDEMGDHPFSFFHHIKDLLRDGDLKYRGMVFPMDLMMITHTTSQEWKGFSDNQSNRPVIERIQSIPVAYNLDKQAEVQVYNKGISVLESPPHIAPNTLETWAELAVSTRITPTSSTLDSRYRDIKNSRSFLLGELANLGDHEATRRIKVDLYSGEEVPGFKKGDVKAIQEEGIISLEGMTGLSPVAARGLLIEMMGQQGKCISPKDLFFGISERLKQGGKPGYVEKDKWNPVISAVKKRWEEGLQKVVLGAFRDDMLNKINTKTTAYIEECELLLGMVDPRIDSNGENIPADITFMTNIEKTIFGKVLTNEERGSILRGLPRKSSQSADKTPERAKFDQGIEQIVLEEGSYRPQDVLKSFPRKQKEVGYIEEARQKLVTDKGFCVHCATESIDYVAQILRQSSDK